MMTDAKRKAGRPVSADPVKVQVRIPSEVLRQIDAAAEADDRSRENWILRVVKDALAKR